MVEPFTQIIRTRGKRHHHSLVHVNGTVFAHFVIDTVVIFSFVFSLSGMWQLLSNERNHLVREVLQPPIGVFFSLKKKNLPHPTIMALLISSRTARGGGGGGGFFLACEDFWRMFDN